MLYEAGSALPLDVNFTTQKSICYQFTYIYDQID
jgi:hypothetical protein